MAIAAALGGGMKVGGRGLGTRGQGVVARFARAITGKSERSELPSPGPRPLTPSPRFLPAAGLILLCALSAPAATFYVTISGLGGEPDYDQRFKMWTEDIDSSLKKS